MYLLINSVDKTDLIAKNSLRYSGNVDSHNLDVSINTRASSYMPHIGQDIKLYSSAGGTVIFGGVIKTLTKEKLEPMAGSNAYIKVGISSDGYGSIPARRNFTDNYTSNETGNLISAVRTMVLNNVTYGNENIGLGNITAGITIESEYYSVECQSAKEVFDDLALISGCKWYIDNSKQLNFVSEDTVTTANHTISATDTESNLILDMVVTESLENYANKIFAAGGIGDDGNIIYATASLTSAITERASIEGTANSSGVYGFVIQDDNIDSMTAASTVAENHLKKYGFEPQEISFYSYTTDWVAGTQISVNLPEFGMTAATTCLIEEVTMTQEDNGILKSYIKCTRRDSANFSTQKSSGGVEFFERIIAGINSGGGGLPAVVIDDTGTAYYVKIYVQDGEPAGAKAKSVWIDTDDYSRYDYLKITAAATITVEDGEFFECTGTAAYTVTIGTASATAGCLMIIKNSNTQTISAAATIDGVSGRDIATTTALHMIHNGTDWRVV